MPNQTPSELIRPESSPPGDCGGAREVSELSDASNGPDKDGISVESLRPGMRLAHDIYDRAGVLLLVAGSEITPRFLRLLDQRGIRLVRPRAAGLLQKTAAPAEIGKARQLDDLLAAELGKQGPMGSGDPVERPRLPLEALWVEAARGLQRHVGMTAVLADICETSQSGQTSSSDKMRSLVGEFVDMLTLDCELLVTVASMQKTLGEYLFDHCVNVALLSMSVAAQLGMSREQTTAIGMGAILQDVGMLRVPRTIRLAPRRLTSQERAEIQRHPLYTLDYLERIRGLPPEAGFIGYQAHERNDASGYPRGRSAAIIHPYAKIVGLADVYTAMTRPRPYRPAILPHEAVKQILVNTRRNRFDRTVVRAFLDAVSAFPIGSLIELKQGVRGQVVRANPGAHTRPIIVLVGPDGNPTDSVIDLSKETHLEVVRALELADSAGIRPKLEGSSAPGR